MGLGHTCVSKFTKSVIVEFCSEKDGIGVFPYGDHEFDVIFGRRCPEVPVSR